MDNAPKEISRNFVPSLPSDLNDDPRSVPEVALGRFLNKVAKKVEGVTLSSQEVQDRTQELYDLLVKRVELRIDLNRLSKEGYKPSGKFTTEPLSLQVKLDQIKNGNIRAVVTEGIMTDVRERTLEGDLKELHEVEQKVSDLTKNSQVAEQYARFREERVEKLRKAKEISVGLGAAKQLRLQQEQMARKTFLESRQYSPGEQKLVDENKQIAKAIEERVDSLKSDPEVFDLTRLRELQDYQKGLKSDRFAETPSREKYIDTVRQYWSQGKKVLLTGPTGGGKTELLMHASRSLFGEEPERLTGHELMTNYEVYGKTKGGVKEGQVTLMFGSAPFVRALERNVPFIFDELNVVPNKILMRLKTDLNARVGQQVTVQEDGDKKIIVGDRFAVGATENVKSEKHTDREKLDPALVRMFESVPIDYFPPAELYDIMLASLMDVRGGIKLSVKDATETLQGLCNATEWIQKSFLGQTVTTTAGQILSARGQESVGKSATLREAILDPGKALDMLVGWEDARQEGLTFREFLDKRIVAFINNENFPEEDRYYLAEIFALQGFLKGVKVEGLRISGLDQNTLNAWNAYDGKRHVPKGQYIPSEVVAKLNPYGKLKRPVSAAANDLLDEGETLEDVNEEEPSLETPTSVSSGTAKWEPGMAWVPPTGTPRPSGLISPDGKRKLETLDVLYPPNNLPPGESDYKRRYETYPKSLVEIAQLDATTYFGVAERLSMVLDGVTPDAMDIRNFMLNVENFAKCTQNQPQVKTRIASIVKRVNELPKWKESSSGGLAQQAVEVIERVEKMLFS